MTAIISRGGLRQHRVLVPPFAAINAGTAERISWHYPHNEYPNLVEFFDNNSKPTVAYRRADGKPWRRA